ncbi:B12-binding domain-containing radical SAM protein [Ruminococcus gauvreauii]|uniref:Radical SAM protein n=1 Tax=Ruminococcus gauvreauii TaxID=438033 RepID=A0ABY5VKL1_9FIRM|nr:radical SAM protein [Ruminococcus gauvreauii]UWP60703.1 radical SAM protein [Ruminococcus gauvreauii]
MRYEGMVYRPPSEARSLIVQVTIGCAHNACTFCTMYKDKKFRIRKKEEVLEDFQTAYDNYGDNIRRIFLADGDALIVKTPDLLDILNFIKEKFPSAERVTSYGTPGDILRKSEDELKSLAEAGLGMVYMGAESGDAVTLKDINKGVSREEIIEAGRKLRRAGIQSSITLISGLGGRARRKEHAVESAKLISDIRPDYVGFLTLMLDESTEIYRKIAAGEMELLTPDEVVEEMRLFLTNVDSPGTVFRANHASNYVVLKGNLNEDIEGMLRKLDEVEEAGKYRPERVRSL